MIKQTFGSLFSHVSSSSLIRCEELHLIDRCHPIDSRPGTLAEILLKHTQEQYDILKATENEPNEQKLEDLSSHYDAIYIHPVSIVIYFGNSIQFRKPFNGIKRKRFE